MPTIEVPWGPDATLALLLPSCGLFAQADIEVLRPDLSSPLVDYVSALGQALDHPVGGCTIEEQVGPGSSVAIVVDDPSRWTPVREALPIILKRLHAAGVRSEDVTISVGVGRHAFVDAEAMRRRVGEEIAASYRCYSPPVDDLSAYDDLGQTPQGIPVRVFRPVARASLRILLGSVLPHLQAGFGGGYKLILPGTSHRTTLSKLHRQGISAHPGPVRKGVRHRCTPHPPGRSGKGPRPILEPCAHSEPAGLLGELAAGNAMRQAIHMAAALLGPCWSISHLTGGCGQVVRIVTGHPEQVQEILAAEAKRRLEAPVGRPSDLVIAGNHPWPGDPMQSFKVLLHHRAACSSSGVLAGLFWTDPDEIDRSFPITALKCIAATGKLGGWSIQRLLPLASSTASAAGLAAAFMIHWACEFVVDRTVLVYSPALHARIGPRLGPVQVFADQLNMWEAAENALACRRAVRAGETLRVRVFPQGGLTYVRESKAIAPCQ